MTKFEKVRAALESRKDRSAWDKGVTLYAFDLLDSLEEVARGGWVAVDDLNDGEILRHTMLNGASGWSDYSYGASALIYDEDIARRLCNPSELKRMFRLAHSVRHQQESALRGSMQFER